MSTCVVVGTGQPIFHDHGSGTSGTAKLLAAEAAVDAACTLSRGARIVGDGRNVVDQVNAALADSPQSIRAETKALRDRIVAKSSAVGATWGHVDRRENPAGLARGRRNDAADKAARGPTPLPPTA